MLKCYIHRIFAIIIASFNRINWDNCFLLLAGKRRNSRKYSPLSGRLHRMPNSFNSNGVLPQREPKRCAWERGDPTRLELQNVSNTRRSKGREAPPSTSLQLPSLPLPPPGTLLPVHHLLPTLKSLHLRASNFIKISLLWNCRGWITCTDPRCPCTASWDLVIAWLMGGSCWRFPISVWRL